MNMFTRSICVLILLCTAITLPALADEPCRSDTALRINDQTALVELAVDQRTRSYGLMFRANMGKNCGMLFVFEKSGLRVFTMRNTLIPLDIAFIDKDGRIGEIFAMEPGGDRYPSKVSALFALEMNKGWFAANNIKVGDIIKAPTETGELAPLDSIVNTE